MLGTYDYPEFPMDEATFGEHIPGRVLHDYVTRNADRFGRSRPHQVQLLGFGRGAPRRP